MGRSSWCKECCNRNQTKTPKKSLYNRSRSSAKTKGLEHTIKLEDIPVPKTCVYLGVELDYRTPAERGAVKKSRAFDVASIDRIDSTLGYVPGNVQVISDLANRMKQDATVEQLIAFAEGVLRTHR